MLNIFESNAFGVIRLTQAINDLKFKPGRIDELGLFEPSSVDTTKVAIERRADQLVIVPPTLRGGPGVTIGAAPPRDLRMLEIPHFEVNDSFVAESVQNVRAFGQEAALVAVTEKIAQQMGVAVNSFAATEEHARMGAVKGIVTYADGSTLNLFSEFAVAPEPVLEWDLSNANPAEGALRRKCTQITRRVADLLGGISFTRVHALCDDAFFDDLLSHREVRETFKGWSESKILRESYVGTDRPSSHGIFEFGGIVWENYRGASIPSARGGALQSFIAPDDCHLFPLGVPGLFKTVYAPADWEDTVNTMGRRLYTRQSPWPNGKGRSLDSQMNALQYCSRPKVLMHGVRGTA